MEMPRISRFRSGSDRGDKKISGRLSGGEVREICEKRESDGLALLRVELGCEDVVLSLIHI